MVAHDSSRQATGPDVVGGLGFFTGFHGITSSNGVRADQITNGGCVTAVKPSGTRNCTRCSANAAFDAVLAAKSAPKAKHPPPTTASNNTLNRNARTAACQTVGQLLFISRLWNGTTRSALGLWQCRRPFAFQSPTLRFARRIRCNKRISFLRASSCSQIRNTRQPLFRKARDTERSRALFRIILARQ